MKPRRSVVIGFLIIIAWAVTMVIVLRDNLSVPQFVMGNDEENSGGLFQSVSVADKWRNISENMLIVRVSDDGKTTAPLGAARTAITYLKDASTCSPHLRAQFFMQAKISPLLPATVIRGTALMNKANQLDEFYLSAHLGSIELKSQGKASKDALRVVISAPTGTSYIKKPLDGPVSLNEVLRPTLGRNLKIAPGAKFSARVVDPFSGRAATQVRIRVEEEETIILGGEPTPAYRVRSSVGDIENLMWVDSAGQTLRRELANNIRMDRTDKETAEKVAPELANWTSSAVFPEFDWSRFDDLASKAGAETSAAPAATGVLEMLWR